MDRCREVAAVRGGNSAGTFNLRPAVRPAEYTRRPPGRLLECTVASCAPVRTRRRRRDDMDRRTGNQLSNAPLDVRPEQRRGPTVEIGPVIHSMQVKAVPSLSNFTSGAIDAQVIDEGVADPCTLSRMYEAGAGRVDCGRDRNALYSSRKNAA